MHRRRVATAFVLGATLIAGCAPDEAIPAPDCDSGGSVLIEAQSVPGASRVPCLGVLPEGWSVALVRIDQDGTFVRFDSDRAGTGAAELRFAPSCDVSAAVREPSDLPAQRFDQIDQLVPRFRGARYYVFPGACVWWRFEFDEGATATETVGIDDTLQLVSRDALNESIHETFLDEDV